MTPSPVPTEGKPEQEGWLNYRNSDEYLDANEWYHKGNDKIRYKEAARNYKNKEAACSYEDPRERHGYEEQGEGRATAPSREELQEGEEEYREIDSWEVKKKHLSSRLRKEVE